MGVDGLSGMGVPPAELRGGRGSWGRGVRPAAGDRGSIETVRGLSSTTDVDVCLVRPTQTSV